MSRFPLTRAWFASATNLEPSLIGSPSFDSVIGARLRELRLPDDAAYAERLRLDADEAARAHALVAVPETWLFRGCTTFDTLRERLLRRRASGQDSIRALSAGCASGAEPWSLAITFAAAGYSPSRIMIDAVDLNPDAVAAVSRGRFGRLGVREAVPPWARPFVRNEGDELVADASLCSSLQAKRADLFTFTPSAPYDVILCRNVLIYLTRPARERLVQRLVGWLAVDGAFGTGHADNVFDLLGGFVPMAPTGAFLFERATQPLSPAAPPIEAPRLPPISRRARPSSIRPATSPQRASERPATRKDELDVALRREPDRIDLLLELSELLLASGDLVRAEDGYRRVVYLDAKHEQALVRLADLAERQGKSDAAARFRARALDAHLHREG